MSPERLLVIIILALVAIWLLFAVLPDAHAASCPVAGKGVPSNTYPLLAPKGAVGRGVAP